MELLERKIGGKKSKMGSALLCSYLSYVQINQWTVMLD